MYYGSAEVVEVASYSGRFSRSDRGGFIVIDYSTSGIRIAIATSEGIVESELYPKMFGKSWREWPCTVTVQSYGEDGQCKCSVWLAGLIRSGRLGSAMPGYYRSSGECEGQTPCCRVESCIVSDDDQLHASCRRGPFFIHPFNPEYHLHIDLQVSSDLQCRLHPSRLLGPEPLFWLT
ncbi:hypothetical protein J6590_014637 [Homalodisca vitripennis]|nr:hypothetical protein J6590_014637 [Homalodisca vitripennis]